MSQQADYAIVEAPVFMLLEVYFVAWSDDPNNRLDYIAHERVHSQI